MFTYYGLHCWYGRNAIGTPDWCICKKFSQIHDHHYYMTSALERCPGDHRSRFKWNCRVTALVRHVVHCIRGMSLQNDIRPRRCWNHITDRVGLYYVSSQASAYRLNYIFSVKWHSLKVLLQWNSTSVKTSCTYSTYHLELALGTFICHFISACLVCHTS